MSTDPDPASVHIARARSIKAFKLARVLRVTDVDVDVYRDADDDFRRYVAVRAGVNDPSDASWQMACDTLAQMRDDDF